MKLDLACKKFQRLWNEQDERSLSERESRFLETHVDACPKCREYEDSAVGALSMLRGSVMEPEVSDNFDDRVLRKVRIQTTRQGLRYWSPALIAGVITCLLVVATLQIAGAPMQLKRASLPAGEAQIGGASEAPMPSLILDTQPRLR